MLPWESTLISSSQSTTHSFLLLPSKAHKVRWTFFWIYTSDSECDDDDDDGDGSSLGLWASQSTKVRLNEISTIKILPTPVIFVLINWILLNHVQFWSFCPSAFLMRLQNFKNTGGNLNGNDRIRILSEVKQFTVRRNFWSKTWLTTQKCDFGQNHDWLVVFFWWV